MPGRQHEQIRSRQESVRIFHEPGEFHMFPDAKFVRARPKLRQERSNSENHQSRSAPVQKKGKCGKKGEEVLLLMQSPDGEHDWISGLFEPGMMDRFGGLS